MRGAERIDWTRTDIQPQERVDLLRALTSEQKAHLPEHDCVRVGGVRVLWKPVDGALRRAGFTSGIRFRTRRGELYVDSEGSEGLHARSPIPTPVGPGGMSDAQELEAARAVPVRRRPPSESRAMKRRPLHDPLLVGRIEEQEGTTRVLFIKYSGTGIQLEGDEHPIIREDDVLAVLE